jgi:hypothetical protein
VAEGVGVTVAGDVVGTPLGRGVPVGDTELVGVAFEVGVGVAVGVGFEVGVGVLVGGDVVATGPGEVAGCTVWVTPAAVVGGGLTRT